MSNPAISRQALRLFVHQTFRSCTPQTTRPFSVHPQRLNHSAAGNGTQETPSSLRPACDGYIPFEKESSAPSSLSSDSNVAAQFLDVSHAPATLEKPAPQTPKLASATPLSNNDSTTKNRLHQHSKPKPTTLSSSPAAKRSPTTTKSTTKPTTPPLPREPWQIQKSGLAAKLGSAAWNPRKKLSPDALEGIRALHAQYPEHFTTAVLAEQFRVSPDAIRRILKSKWRPSVAEEEARLERWERRGERVWRELSETRGVHPPRRWREKGIGVGTPRRPTAEQWAEIERRREELKGEGGTLQAGGSPRLEHRSWIEPRPR